MNQQTEVVSDEMLPIGVNELFQGIISSVEQNLLPELQSPFARGQARAIAGVLRNLSGRVIEAPSATLRENAAYEKFFREIQPDVSRLARDSGSSHWKRLAHSLNALLTRRGRSAPEPAVRNRELKAALTRVIRLAGRLRQEPKTPRKARTLGARLDKFLQRRVQAEAQLLQPMRWKDIAADR